MEALEVSVTSPPAQNTVAPLAVMVGVAAELTVTLVAAEVAEHPFPSVIVTDLFPELLTVML